MTNNNIAFPEPMISPEALALLGGIMLGATERIPSAPARYFNDYAGAVSPAAAEELNATLDQFERTDS